MFGERIDYLLLRPLTHDRNRATEAELQERADRTPFDASAAHGRLDKLLRRLEGHLQVVPELRYLDVGCGTGDLTLALSLAGATDVTGIDLLERNVRAARHACGAIDRGNAPEFVHGDVVTWRPSGRFDVIVSHEALEHIDHPDRFLSSLSALMSPQGRAVLAFGPLFHSLLGDHQWGYFRVQIPWRPLLFSERAIAALRRERFRPDEDGHHLRGLNRMRYSEFIRYVRMAGLEFEFLSVNPQLERIPGLHALSRGMVSLPWIQDYVAGSVYCVLRRAESRPSE